MLLEVTHPHTMWVQSILTERGWHEIWRETERKLSEREEMKMAVTGEGEERKMGKQ